MTECCRTQPASYQQTPEHLSDAQLTELPRPIEIPEELQLMVTSQIFPPLCNTIKRYKATFYKTNFSDSLNFCFKTWVTCLSILHFSN